MEKYEYEDIQIPENIVPLIQEYYRKSRFWEEYGFETLQAMINNYYSESNEYDLDSGLRLPDICKDLDAEPYSCQEENGFMVTCIIIQIKDKIKETELIDLADKIEEINRQIKYYNDLRRNVSKYAFICDPEDFFDDEEAEIQTKPMESLILVANSMAFKRSAKDLTATIDQSV